MDNRCYYFFSQEFLLFLCKYMDVSKSIKIWTQRTGLSQSYQQLQTCLLKGRKEMGKERKGESSFFIYIVLVEGSKMVC